MNNNKGRQNNNYRGPNNRSGQQNNPFSQSINNNSNNQRQPTSAINPFAPPGNNVIPAQNNQSNQNNFNKNYNNNNNNNNYNNQKFQNKPKQNVNQPSTSGFNPFAQQNSSLNQTQFNNLPNPNPFNQSNVSPFPPQQINNPFGNPSTMNSNQPLQTIQAAPNLFANNNPQVSTPFAPSGFTPTTSTSMNPFQQQSQQMINNPNPFNNNSNNLNNQTVNPFNQNKQNSFTQNNISNNPFSRASSNAFNGQPMASANSLSNPFSKQHDQKKKDEIHKEIQNVDFNAILNVTKNSLNSGMQDDIEIKERLEDQAHEPAPPLISSTNLDTTSILGEHLIKWMDSFPLKVIPETPPSQDAYELLPNKEYIVGALPPYPPL